MHINAGGITRLASPGETTAVTEEKPAAVPH